MYMNCILSFIKFREKTQIFIKFITVKSINTYQRLKLPSAQYKFFIRYVFFYFAATNKMLKYTFDLKQNYIT